MTPTPMSIRVCSLLANKGWRRAAVVLAQICAGVSRSPLVRQRLRVFACHRRIEAAGSDPAWHDTVETACDMVEAELHTGCDPEVVADLAFEALVLLFHPSIQQNGATSPLIADAESLSHLFAHPLLQRLRCAPSSPQENTPRKTARTGRTRLLVISDGAMNFVDHCVARWRSAEHVEVRVRSLTEEDVDEGWWNLRRVVHDRLAGRSPSIPSWLTEDVSWADVIFSEWGGAFSAALSGAEITGRMVVRIHRYEAFTLMPMLTVWENVDDLLVVSHDSIATLSVTVPNIEARTRIHHVPNVVDLTANTLPKTLAASRTMALIGYSWIKDPAWALDVLECLRATDPAWRLLLVGPDPTGSETGTQAIDRRRFNERVTHLGDAVERLGRREDIPEVLRNVGVIVSSSRVESAHLALQEGTASGALPVVRDWPWVKGLGGARTIYPKEWVVDTPEQAADRINGRKVPEGSIVDYEEERRWVIEHCDSSVIGPRMDAILFEAIR